MILETFWNSPEIATPVCGLIRNDMKEWKVLKNLRRNFERFCFQNRNKGIPNLMLYIALGSGVLSLFSMINGGEVVYELMMFDKTKILQGQVWRLVS